MNVLMNDHILHTLYYRFLFYPLTAAAFQLPAEHTPPTPTVTARFSPLKRLVEPMQLRCVRPRSRSRATDPRPATEPKYKLKFAFMSTGRDKCQARTSNYTIVVCVSDTSFIDVRCFCILLICFWITGCTPVKTSCFMSQGDFTSISWSWT